MKEFTYSMDIMIKADDIVGAWRIFSRLTNAVENNIYYKDLPVFEVLEIQDDDGIVYPVEE